MHTIKQGICGLHLKMKRFKFMPVLIHRNLFWILSKRMRNFKNYLSRLETCFSASTAFTFKSVFLLSRIYMIEIPPDSGLILRVDKLVTSSQQFPVHVAAFPFQSVMSTLDYGVTVDKDAAILQSIHIRYYTSLPGYTLKFTVVDYNIPAWSECWFTSANETETV